MGDIRIKILRALAEKPQKKLKASEVKRKAENLQEGRKVNARDYGNILRGLRRDGFLETDLESTPAKWRITERGLNRLEEEPEIGKKTDPYPKAPRDEEGMGTRLELYESGLSDKKIAERMDVSRSAIQAWRSRRDLPPNPAKRKKRIGKGLEKNIKTYLIRKLENRTYLDQESVTSEILESLDENMDWGEAWRRAKKLLNEKLSGVKPEDAVSEVWKEVGIREEVKEKANQIISEYREKGPISGSPSGIAAGSIYLASLLLDERLTQKKIASALGITPVAVRNRFQKIAESLGIDYTHTRSGLPKVRGRKLGG